jgi:hypothetical protein
MAYWAQATRILRSFLPEVLHLSLEDFDSALRCLEEQGSLGGEVRRPPLQELSEPLTRTSLPKVQFSARQSSSTASKSSIFSAHLLVSRGSCLATPRGHVASQLRAEGGHLAVGDVEVCGIQVGVDADTEEDEVEATIAGLGLGEDAADLALRDPHRFR